MRLLILFLGICGSVFGQTNSFSGEYRTYFNKLCYIEISVNTNGTYLISQVETGEYYASSELSKELIGGKYSFEDSCVAFLDSSGVVAAKFKMRPWDSSFTLTAIGESSFFNKKLDRKSQVLLSASFQKVKWFDSNGNVSLEGDWIFNHHFGFLKHGVWTYYKNGEEINSVLYFMGDRVRDPYSWSYDRIIRSEPALSEPKAKIKNR